MTHIAATSQQDNLGALAATVRMAHAGVTFAATNLVEHALAAGDALIAAKAALKIDVGHGHWLAWLKNECDLSEDRAARYMRIARGRETLEANSARVRNLSLAGALKLLPLPGRKGGTLRCKKTRGATSFDALGWWSAASLEARRHFLDGVGSRPLATAIPASWNLTLGIPDDVAAVPNDACLARAVSARPLPTLDWRAATLAQRTAYLARIPIPELLAALSREQRLEIEDRIDGLRAVQAKPIAAIARH